MSDVKVQESVEITNGKHFNAVLVSLKTVNDILRNIDQMCAYAVRHGKINMLGNSIRLKAPEILDAFRNYQSKANYKRATIGAVTCPSSFAEWALLKNLIPIEVIEASKNGKPIKPFKELTSKRNTLINAINKAKKVVCSASPSYPACPYCGKKFKPESKENLSNHSCRKPKRRKSVWVISGGGANGIRNKR